MHETHYRLRALLLIDLPLPFVGITAALQAFPWKTGDVCSCSMENRRCLFLSIGLRKCSIHYFVYIYGDNCPKFYENYEAIQSILCCAYITIYLWFQYHSAYLSPDFILMQIGPLCPPCPVTRQFHTVEPVECLSVQVSLYVCIFGGSLLASVSQ